MKYFITLFLLCGFLSISGLVYAEETHEEVNTGQDWTRPLSRFDIRQKYQDLPDSNEAHTTMFRLDQPFVLKSGWLLALRNELPLVTKNNVGSQDNPDSDMESGMGDILNQFLLIAPQGQKRWTYGFGAQFLWPTGSEDQMGTGRYQIAPIVGAKMDLPGISKGTFTYILLRNHIDAGGHSGREEQNYLVIQPAINFALPKASFVTIAPEMKVNWEDNNRWFIPFDITVGKMLNKTTVVSLEYKTPMRDEKYEFYDHELEARIGFFF